MKPFPGHIAAVVPLSVGVWTALLGLDDPDPLRRATSLLGLVLLVHVGGLVISSAGQPAPAGGGDSFRYAPGRYYWAVSASLLGAAFLAVFAVDIARTGGAAWLITALFGGLAAVFAAIAGTALLLAPGRIVLTSAGIHQRSILHEHFVPWTAVTAVRANPARPGRFANITVRVAPAGGARVRRPLGGLSTMLTGLPDMVVSAYWLGAAAAPAFRALSHYAEHPAERPGLAAPRDVAGVC
ncbi:hypothetical protein GCM10010172_80960 [Paractinoplanes ferrugineus]|uniref:PH (Pleckstrin Homology) domain-containing protein n=1 Tax=Paractinoplanes ferrugineus TaxID=113564 RepID=A0A919IZ21_9ACTN|nr:hypothetical protein [Actinoplanes ferrugineus]GIE10417.1 hypothetical protein Afe05nite_22570 [Actinoplanes ferrugineus]